MVAIPLVLPMGWMNIPLAFSTGTETIADLANAGLQNPLYSPPLHPRDDLTALKDMPEAASPKSAGTPHAAKARVETPPPMPEGSRPVDASPGRAVGVPTQCDPYLPTTGDPL